MKGSQFNSHIKKLIASRDWTYFLTRPFTLFGASLWQEWYHSSLGQRFFGGRIDVIFIEEYPNIVRSYRPASQAKNLDKPVFKILSNTGSAIKLLQEGVKLNERANRLLSGKEKFYNLTDAVEFFIELGLKATAMPNRIGFFEKEKRDKLNQKIITLAETLRKESLYPLVFDKVIVPLAKAKLIEYGIKNAEQALGVLTYKEIMYNNLEQLSERLEKRKLGERFVYSVLNLEESVMFTKNYAGVIKLLEPIRDSETIKGQPAFFGKVIGKVKIVNDFALKSTDFNIGDILVSVSTSAVYLPLMKKAGAIISDDGGIMSHAAVLSRELKKPCIVGTKFASRTLKDGDLIEVDATNGTVKIMKRAR